MLRFFGFLVRNSGSIISGKNAADFFRSCGDSFDKNGAHPSIHFQEITSIILSEPFYHSGKTVYSLQKNHTLGAFDSTNEIAPFKLN